MILDQFRLDGRVALITGGNRGLGLGIATALAEAGANIVSVQRSADTSTLAARVATAGRQFLPLTFDIAQDNAAHRILEATLTRFGKLDILVNNAGITRRAPAEDFPLEDWDAVISVNLRAVFKLSQVCGRQMLQQG